MAAMIDLAQVNDPPQATQASNRAVTALRRSLREGCGSGDAVRISSGSDIVSRMLDDGIHNCNLPDAGRSQRGAGKSQRGV
jgi:hypothetical protein